MFRIKNNYPLGLLILIIFFPYYSFSQNNSKGLIFNEVYFEKQKPNCNWIEIYNPTDKSLTVERFRLSNVRTLNVLPAKIRKQGGITINPNQYCIICAEKEKFNSLWEKQKNVFEISALNYISSGGYVVLFTAGLKDSGIDAFRYGNPEKTENYSFFSDQVLNLSGDGKSYSRELKIISGEKIPSDFYKTNPTPGKPNK